MKIIQTKADRTFDIINVTFLILLTFIFLYPLVFILSASFSDPDYVNRGEVWLLPKGFSFTPYIKVFENGDIIRSYWNTIMYVVVGTVINVALTIMAAYPLSRKDLVGRNVFTMIFTFTMFFSGGLIPLYLVTKQLGLIDNFWVMILPSAISMFNVIVMRTYFQTSIPEELYQAADIDGCSKIGVLFRIVLPLSGPIIAVILLWYAVGHWNSYFNALIFLSDRNKFPLQLILREILVQNDLRNLMQANSSTFIQDSSQFGSSIKYAVIVVSTLPVLIMYPFVQKYFVKGVMIGAIKG
ncbi:carbohydrate ABC transporter permease [Paenibacillus nasutitermitis]|uniref:Sugar ABC transporter permease n=1 Tax=Paenibacillus nasutitermitis TaxID=1652958 RepID=A0A917DMQ4_9BACL|nr:carbohydrate ABC transporter permease [Paenibacillus nasutitermitis]GGD49253.1 sugar ABC transporter permease [Paenibacillus nasutitermitis]